MSDKPSLIIYRPHSEIWFRNPVRRILRGITLPNKYSPLFDHILNSDISVYLASNLVTENGLKGFLKRIIDPVELLFWCILNRISLSKVRFIISPLGLRGKGAIFLMHYGNFTYEQARIAQRGQNLAECLAALPIRKIVHMTHYAYNPTIGFNNLSILKPDLLVAENNLAKNSEFFQKYFGSLNSSFSCLPYTASSRFKKKTPFRNRTNKLVVTGSITFKMKDREFVDFYGEDELQPMRRRLFNCAGDYADEMNCLVSDLNAYREKSKTLKRDSLLVKIIRRVKGHNPQKNYYSKDIVTTYNEHRMFAVPEEICDFPAIGFVEGMACGCAYFGLDNPMYRDLGLIPSVHYVGYDGSVPDLMSKVRYYQEHIDELETIASRGYEFISNHLTPEIVYRDFLEQLKLLTA